MKIFASIILAIVCMGSVSMGKGPKANKKTPVTASKACADSSKKNGKCVAGGSRAPASVSVVSEASVRREAAEKSYSTTPNDPGSK